MSPEAPPLAVVELDSIVGILIAKFPGYTRAYVRSVVSDLISLTLNRARFQLEDASALCSADRL